MLSGDSPEMLRSTAGVDGPGDHGSGGGGYLIEDEGTKGPRLEIQDGLRVGIREQLQGQVGQPSHARLSSLRREMEFLGP